LLVMLGVKSTSKDRWRQVMTEADRIPQKHLCTLEAGISTKQTDEMRRSLRRATKGHRSAMSLPPAGLHATYTSAQRSGLLSVADFVEFARGRQTLRRS
jgi:chaperone required for assembly of F1-ATPase